MSKEKTAEEKKGVLILAIVFLIAAIGLAVFAVKAPEFKHLIYLIAFAPLLSALWQYKEKEHRVPLVLAWAFIGGVGGCYFIYLMEISTSEFLPFFHTIKCDYEGLIAPIFLLIISAPVSFYLWTCRNKDKLEQIEQADKQNKHNEEQNRLNSLSNAMRLFFDKDNKHAKATGLRILAKIRRESKAFASEIDMATPGVDLAESDLTGADLTGIDLSRATLTKAKLPNAYLTGATLTGASMLGVDLTKAELTGATLEDIAIAVDESNIYKKTYDNKFSQKAIEEFLKKDWSERENLVYAQVKKKEENREYYYYFEAVPTPSPRTTDTAPADSSSPIDSPPPAGSASATPTPSDSSNQGKMLRFGIKESESARATRGSADAYFNQGKTKLESGDFDGAIKDFDKALELDANHADAYRLRADARLRKGME